MAWLYLLWVAAHHGLPKHGAAGTLDVGDQVRLWGFVHEINVALGCPGAPRS